MPLLSCLLCLGHGFPPILVRMHDCSMCMVSEPTLVRHIADGRESVGWGHFKSRELDPGGAAEKA